MFLERGSLGKKGLPADTAEVAEVLCVAAKRPDLADMAVVMVALDQDPVAVAQKLLAKDPKTERQGRRLAAAVLAVRGKIADLDAQAPRAQGVGAKRKAKLEIARLEKEAQAVVRNIGDVLPPLLDDADPEVVELAVRAAAYFRVEAVKNKVLALRAEQPAVAAAQLFYQARLKLPVNDAQIDRLFAVPPPVDRAYTRATPALSTVSLRQPAWCVACEALGELGQEKYLKQLHRAMENDDLRVQMDAVRAIEQIGAARSVPALLARLKNSAWPVRVVLLSALGAIPSAEAIPPLIALLEKEQGRFRLDINYALASIAGNTNNCWTADDWQRWWETNRASFRVDRAATEKFRAGKRVADVGPSAAGGNGAGTSFYGVDILSQRLSFVLDFSNSMKGNKIASLKETLHNTLRLMPMDAGIKLNIVSFGGVVNVLEPGKLIGLDRLEEIIKKVQGTGLTLGTRSFDAIEEGILLPEVDTVIFLSDGMPVGGQFQVWERIDSALGLLNRYRPIAIHTIEFKGKVPAKAKPGASRGSLGMRNLAARFGGTSTTPKAPD